MGIQRKQIVCNDVDDVWRDFLEQNKVECAEELLKDGWLTIKMLSEKLGLRRSRASELAQSLECKEAIHNGKRTKFWRPKV